MTYEEIKAMVAADDERWNRQEAARRAAMTQHERDAEDAAGVIAGEEARTFLTQRCGDGWWNTPRLSERRDDER